MTQTLTARPVTVDDLFKQVWPGERTPCAILTHRDDVSFEHNTRRAPSARAAQVPVERGMGAR